jgi:uncharacterized phiE125 gp8 family phage protein
MADLTTIANAKAWLNVTSTSDDALITRLISAASDYIQAWLNRTIAITAYNAVRDGHGGVRMMFSNYPVISVQSILIDDQAIPLATNSQSAGYQFNSTSVWLQGGYKFTRGYGNVQLNYTAGFAAVPNEVEQACIELVSLRYKERDRIGQVSKSIGGETVTFTQKDFTDSVETALTNYKKVVLL